MSPTSQSPGPGFQARATVWFDDRLDRVVVTVDWADPGRAQERIEFDRLQLANEFLERNEFRPMPQHTSIWLLEAPPENVVCIDEWRRSEEIPQPKSDASEEVSMADDVQLSENLPDWLRDHIERYLRTDGEDGHLWDSSFAGGPGPVPTLLLTTTGRRSGEPRILPLIYGEHDGSYTIIASNGGNSSHPAWYLNLVENPEVHIQVKALKTKARARTAGAEERGELWQLMRDIFPPYDDYQKKTDREIPVVILEPIRD